MTSKTAILTHITAKKFAQLETAQPRFFSIRSPRSLFSSVAETAKDRSSLSLLFDRALGDRPLLLLLFARNPVLTPVVAFGSDLRLCVRPRRSTPPAINSSDSASSPGASLQSQNSIQIFSYNQLKSATGNFHPTNKIGQGGFGSVYKGVFSDGNAAIKRLSAESNQGVQEFVTEIKMVSNIRHPNLVNLIGFCIEGTSRLLVYEYLENNSLASILLGSNKQVALNWSQRAAICLGTARGLAFLHEEADPQIVHRDIKASNILLDKNLQPKIGDFGIAKFFPDTISHISTRVAGTIGYLAPEYALLGQLTKKADIYSFGVLTLEIISGRGNERSVFGPEMKTLLEWTWQLWNEDRLLDIVDPVLVEYPKDEIQRFIMVALVCTQATSNKRPDMKKVVQMLQSNEINFDVKSLRKPGVVKEVDISLRVTG